MDYVRTAICLEELIADDLPAILDQKVANSTISVSDKGQVFIDGRWIASCLLETFQLYSKEFAYKLIDVEDNSSGLTLAADNMRVVNVEK